MDPEWWLFFLLANLCLCSSQNDIHIRKAEKLAAEEGSCVTIDCIYMNTWKYTQLFWFKDAVYNNEKQIYEGTIVYSNMQDRPQTSGRRYAHRVQYQGNDNQASCTLRINELEKADSGNYSFRIIGGLKYMSKSVSLTVKDNPCKVHIEPEDKKTLREGDTVSLRCSTSAQCSHHPEWYKVISERVSEPMTANINSETQDEGGNKITELKLSVTWEDNGRIFSCRPAGSKDDCQARNITLEVKYKPRETEVQNSPDTVKEGDTVTLYCSSKAHPNASFTWYKNNSLIQGGSSEYKKYNINPADSGNYSCQAENDLGKNVSLPVRINVLYAPKDVQIKAEPSDVKIGDTLRLKCSEQSSNPAPHAYSWYKDGDQLNRLETGSFLTITELKQSNSGWYHCEAINRIKSTASKSINISVKYAPMNTYITGRSEIKLGSSLCLSCSTNANPPSNHYSWYFKPEDTQQYFLLPQMTNELYQIKEVNIEDSGSYICSPRNIIGAGSNSTEFKFNVLYPPSQPNLTMVETIRDAEKLSISCTVKSYPAAEMTLSRTSLQNRGDVLIKQDKTSPIFFSASVSEAHAGHYTCRAKNSEGQSNTTRELKVLYAPKDVQVLDDSGQNWIEGNNLELTCIAHSEPTVSTYTWEKPSEKEIKSNSETEWTQKLNIYNLTSADSGYYFCTAGNELGYTRSASFEIRVKYRPNITITHNLTALNNWDGKAPVSLTCNVDCYPPVTNYQWFTKEENTILSYDQTYIVYPQKQGTYYCVAKNEIGESTSHPVKLMFKGLFQQIFLWILISVFFLCILMVVILLVHRIVLRKESSDGADSQSFFIPAIRARFLTGSQNNTRENLVMEGEMEPYSHRHNQPASTANANISANRQNHAGRPVPNIHTVYDAVKRPEAIQENPAMSTVNYANLQIKNHNNPSKSSSEAGTVYAVVSKNKQNTKVVPEGNDDYENVSSAHAPKLDFSNINWDSDSSEEEEELNYSKVTFTATQQHKPRRTREDSSSDEEERTQYSQVKFN